MSDNKYVPKNILLTGGAGTMTKIETTAVAMANVLRKLIFD
jgi:hypothetical protein